jgi:phage baseplate assembly protein W
MIKKYKDIDFSFTKNRFTGDLNIVEDSVSIRQSIKNILLTFSGEKSFDPEFGGELYNNIFSSSSDINLTLSSDIKMMLVRYEPRIQVISVKTKTENNVFVIDLQYNYYLQNATISDSASIKIPIQ